MGVSILDIAALAGVSKSTVSAVINQHPHVRQETRERVLDAIRQLDYHPNVAARELITSAPMNIGVIMPSYSDTVSNSENRYFQGIDEGSNLELISQLIEKISTTRYGVLVEHSIITEGELQLPSFALSRRVAGVFQISPLFNQAFVEKLCQYVPTVVEIGVPSDRCDCVYSDFEETVRRSVDYLAKLGHKRIAFINCDPASRTADMRLEGYLSGLQRNRLSYEPKWVSASPFSGQGGYRAFESIWRAKNENPTAVICATGTIAGGAVRYMQENGISIPDDVSVISNGDSPLCEFLMPRITVICRDKKRSVERAFSLMMERLKDPTIPRCSVRIEDHMIERESVKRII